jgi:uncharacterized membrane protein YdjX (TVP38/TMEM64 family)
LTLCYATARSGLRPRLESLLRRFEYELPQFEEGDRGSLRFTLLVKLAPGAPAAVKNYLLGIIRVPFPLYFGASMLIAGAYAVLCAVVGDSLFEHHVVRGLLAGVVVVAAVAAGLWRWRKRQDHRERDVALPKAWQSRGAGSRRS